MAASENRDRQVRVDSTSSTHGGERLLSVYGRPKKLWPNLDINFSTIARSPSVTMT